MCRLFYTCDMYTENPVAKALYFAVYQVVAYQSAHSNFCLSWWASFQAYRYMLLDIVFICFLCFDLS